MLKAFYDRLRHICADDGQGAGLAGEGLVEWQAQHARALADEWGILRPADCTWEQWKAEDPDVKYGTEHIFEFVPESGLVHKTTIPGKFGLMPQAVRHPVINPGRAAGPVGFRMTLETRPATPLEYLERWLEANAVFSDAVKLVSAVEWSDARLSFSITQPQYNGEPAAEHDIVTYFERGGWKWIADPTHGGHLLFFHYAWGLLAYERRHVTASYRVMR